MEFTLERSFELHLKLREVEGKEEKVEIIREFIETGDDLNLPAVPEFEKGALMLRSFIITQFVISFY